MTQILPYSFDEIQEVLKQEAIDTNLVSDAEYEGSNISQLIRILSYAVQSCNISSTYGVNEMLITQTTERNNILKLARQLGYVPKQRISYRYKLKIRPNEAGVHKISKYSEFTSGDYTYYYFGSEINRQFDYYISAKFASNPPNNTDGSNYIIGNPDILPGSIIKLENYKTAEIISIEDDPFGYANKKLIRLNFAGNIINEDELSNFTICDSGGFILTEGLISKITDTRTEIIEVKEGILKKHYDLELNPNGEKDLYRVISETDEDGQPLSYLDFNYYNVEEEGIELWVTHFDDSGLLNIKEEWVKRDYFIVDKDIFEEKRTFLPLIDIDLETLRIYFSIADTGVTPKLFSKVYVNLLLSSGDKGKAIAPFEFVSLDKDSWTIIDGDNLIIETIGRDVEVAEDIRINATTFHNTANRAVTRKDYIAICNRDNSIKESQCWGGELNLPYKHLGHIFFSFLPEYRPIEFLGDSTSSVFKLNKTKYTDDEFNLSGDEIRNVNLQNNSNANTKSLGIFDTLDSYKIITLDLHHVYNHFVDMSLVIDIRKYYITQSVASVNQNLKNKIVEYFQETVESYDYDFFRSNLVRIIDSELGLTSGLSLDLTTEMSLYTEHLEEIPEITNLYNVDIWFGYPFDGVEDEYQYFSNEMIPNIDTENFLRDNTGKELYIGRYKKTGPLMSGTTGIRLDDNSIIELDIFYGYNKRYIKNYDNKTEMFNDVNLLIPETDNKVGKVYINNKEKTILIRLYVKDFNAADYVPSNCYNINDFQGELNTIISTDDFLITDPVTGIQRENELKIDLKYPFDDINFEKNTIARLISLEFI